MALGPRSVSAARGRGEPLEVRGTPTALPKAERPLGPCQAVFSVSAHCVHYVTVSLMGQVLLPSLSLQEFPR